LAVLTGLPVKTRADLPVAAISLQSMGGDGLSVLATGGHLEPPDDLLLLPGGESVWLPGQHIASSSTHGTGCAFSSALLSQIVLGRMPQTAALAAKDYVASAIRRAFPMGGGKGPLNHLWPLQPPE
jgi:hydroxymethylpyrimidine/phosphomethylpyrimidine kinase